MNYSQGLERKFQQFDVQTGLSDDTKISGYASVFGTPDQGGDAVQKGAYAQSLAQLAASGRSVKMLWQHDPTKPIGVWDDIHEDEHGLFVSGHLIPDIQAGAEALTLLKAGALDGLSIGYRTKQASKSPTGGRSLTELELWEVSLVTFPMLPEARVSTTDEALTQELVETIAQASQTLLA